MRRNIALGRILETDLRCEKCQAKTKFSNIPISIANIQLNCGCILNMNSDLNQYLTHNTIDFDNSGITLLP